MRRLALVGVLLSAIACGGAPAKSSQLIPAFAPATGKDPWSPPTDPYERQTAYDQLHCSFLNVYCVTSAGLSFNDDEMPRELQARGALDIIIIGSRMASAVLPSLTVNGEQQSRSEALLRTDLHELGVVRYSISLVGRDKIDATLDTGKFGQNSPDTVVQLKIKLTELPPKNYWEVGVNTIAVLPSFAQKITAYVPPGISQPKLRLETTWSPILTVSVRIFPTGSSATLPSVWDRFAVEVGLGLDADFRSRISLAPLHQAHLGASLLVIKGAWISAGGAANFGAIQYAPGYRDGRIAPSDLGDATSSTVRFSPYIGVGVSTDLYASIRATLSSVPGQKQQ